MDLPKKDSKDLIASLTKFLEENVNRGKEYTFYKWDKEKNIVWFNQTYLNKQIFFDTKNFEETKENKSDYEAPNGMVKFILDDKGNLKEYTQTYLVIYTQGESQEIISPKKALGRLLDTAHLTTGDHVQDIRLGFFSLVLVGDSQVYAPTWLIETEDGQYLVNATDSSIQVLSGEQD